MTWYSNPKEKLFLEPDKEKFMEPRKKKPTRRVLIVGEEHGTYRADIPEYIKILKILRKMGKNDRTIILVRECLPGHITLDDKYEVDGVDSVKGIENIEDDLRSVVDQWAYRYYTNLYKKQTDGKKKLPYSVKDFLELPSDTRGVARKLDRVDAIKQAAEMTGKPWDDVKKDGLEKHILIPQEDRGRKMGGYAMWLFACVSKANMRLKYNSNWHQNLLTFARMNPKADFVVILGSAHLGSVKTEWDEKLPGMIDLLKKRPGSFSKISWGWTKKPNTKFYDAEGLNIDPELISTYDTNSKQTTTKKRKLLLGKQKKIIVKRQKWQQPTKGKKGEKLDEEEKPDEEQSKKCSLM